MLGREVADPEGIEGPAGADPGLGLLDVSTVMTPKKRLTEVGAIHVSSGTQFRGYEIHIGETDGPDRARPFAHVDDAPEGAVSGNRRIAGSYLHGMFRDDAFRAAFLSDFGVVSSNTGYDSGVEETLDALAAHLEAHLDVDGLLFAAR